MSLINEISCRVWVVALREYLYPFRAYTGLTVNTLIVSIVSSAGTTESPRCEAIVEQRWELSALCVGGCKPATLAKGLDRFLVDMRGSSGLQPILPRDGEMRYIRSIFFYLYFGSDFEPILTLRGFGRGPVSATDWWLVSQTNRLSGYVTCPSVGFESSFGRCLFGGF